MDNKRTLNIDRGRLYIGGDLNLNSVSKSAGSGYINMQNAEDYILVNGNMFVYSCYEYSKLTSGTIEIKGDFTQKYYTYRYDTYQSNFCCSGTHKVILSGENTQSVSFASTLSQFNILEVYRPINTGYKLVNANWNELIENIRDTSLPDAPVNLQFVRSTSTSILIRWTNPANMQKIYGYEVYRNGKLIGATAQNEFIDNGLLTHTQYEYYVVAVGINGVKSELSNTITASADVDAYVPTTPTGVEVLIRKDGSVYLTWIASSDNVSVDGYNLYRNGIYIGNTSGTAYNDKDAEPGYHEYYVEAFDNEGNNSLYSSSVYADNMPPEKPVLYVSDITPSKISLKWDSSDNVEIDHYEIYKNGEFLKNTNVNAYTDISIEAGGEYSYFVIAIDTSGNISEISDTKKVTAQNDEETPEIGISDQVLTENNKILNVVCTDNIMLSSLTAKVKPSSSDEWIILKTQNLSQKSQIVKLNLEELLIDSGDYDITVEVSDTAGNTETAESKFSYAKNELKEVKVFAVSDGCSVQLSWTAASDKSDVYYEIRRIDLDGTSKYIATSKFNELSYVDKDLYPLTKYSYIVTAHDENMYSASGETVSVTTGKDTVSPIARAGSNITTIAGQEVKFDGSRSADNFGIKTYSWDFGDKDTSNGKTLSHIYTEAGTYTVQLTVTDESGNIGQDALTVTVYDEDYSITEIRITDDNGRALPNSAAYCVLPDIGETTFYSDNNGIISLVAKNGTYDFYFFANDFLPLKESLTINGISVGDKRQSVSMKKSELVTAEFNVRELDIEEVKELGIDVTAPENQYVCKVEMKVDNIDTGSKDVFEVIVNQNGELINIEANESFVKKSFDRVETKTTSSGTSTTSTSTSTLQSGITTKSGKPAPVSLKTMVSMSVTEYSWLKDFYEVSITFTNNSDEGFDILNPQATLVLPNGLSLASTDASNSISRTMNTIGGGKSETVSWIIKGDAKGGYKVSVDFKGALSPFGIPIEASFENNNFITVTGGDALKLTLNASLKTADFTLRNISSEVIYNAKVSMNSYGEFKDAQKLLLQYPSELVEKIEWADEGHAEIKSTVYFPANMDPNTDISTLRTLKPGESIIGKLWYRQNVID